MDRQSAGLDPVLHDQPMLAVDGADMAQIIRIIEAAGKALLVQRQRIVARRAPHIDEPGVRQHAGDGPRQQVVAGRLVGGKRPALGAGEHALVDPPALVLHNRPIEVDRGARPFVAGGDGPLHLQTLAERHDIRMGGQNLLGQGGARARHAEDEHRPRAVEAVGPLPGDELRRIGGLDQGAIGLMAGDLEHRLSGFQRIGLAQHVEGTPVIAGLVVKLVERETGRRPRRGGGRAVLGLPQQRAFGLGLEAIDHCQAMIGLGRVLLDLEHLAQFRLGAVEIAAVAEDGGTRHPGLGDIVAVASALST
jgi:hypothetical protein